MTRQKAFTLVESLIVVGIIAILMAISVPVISRAKERGRLVACMANLRGQATALVNYANANKFNFPYVGEGNSPVQYMTGGAKDTRIFWKTLGLIIRHHGYSLLWEAHTVDQGELFYCPSQRDKNYTYADYDDPSWPPEKQVLVGYNLLPLTVSESNRLRLSTSVKTLEPTGIMAVDLVESNTAGGGRATRTAHSPAWNVLRGDGTVEFIKDPVAEQYILDRPNLINATGGRHWDFVMDRFMGGSGNDRFWYTE